MKKYYDAVIVGCGVAGCFAALHLPQEADILMITKQIPRTATPSSHTGGSRVF